MKRTTEERINEIKRYILTNEKMTTKELSSLCGVTPEMIRKDLEFLEKRGFLIRIHGGAVLRKSNVDVPLDIRREEKKELKDALCNIAINYINNDDLIFIDPSSTALQLGRLIRIRKNIQLVTNCFNLLNIAADSGQKIFFLGGDYSRSGNRTQGTFLEIALKKFVFDVSVFGADGCYGINGPGTQSEDAAFLNEEIMSRSRKKILMMDSSKFNVLTRYKYATFKDFDVLITDEVPFDYDRSILPKEVVELNKQKKK